MESLRNEEVRRADKRQKAETKELDKAVDAHVKSLEYAKSSHDPMAFFSIYGGRTVAVGAGALISTSVAASLLAPTVAFAALKRCQSELKLTDGDIGSMSHDVDGSNISASKVAAGIPCARSRKNTRSASSSKMMAARP